MAKQGRLGFLEATSKFVTRLGSSFGRKSPDDPPVAAFEWLNGSDISTKLFLGCSTVVPVNRFPRSSVRDVV